MRSWLRTLLLGAALGLGTSAINHLPGDAGRVLGSIVGLGWSWAAIGVVAGYLARPPGRLARAALAATGCLLVAVTCYYLLDEAFGVYGSIDQGSNLGSMLGDLECWSVGALITGPPLGVAGAWCHRAGVVGLAGRLAIPVAAIGDTALRVQPSASMAGTDGDRLSNAIMWVVLIVGALATLVLIGLAVTGRGGPARRLPVTTEASSPGRS